MTLPSDRSNEFEQVALVHAESLLRVAQRVTRNHHAAEDAVQEALPLWESCCRRDVQVSTDCFGYFANGDTRLHQ